MTAECEKEVSTAGGRLYYAARGEGAVITGCTKVAGELVIPGSIEGLMVIGIEKKAFLSQKQLRAVCLPDTLKYVGDWAFAFCDRLERVEFGDREISFGKAVFLDCDGLRFLEIRGREETDAVLLAAAVTLCDAAYLLNVRDVGSAEWLAKWDARMLTLLHMPDSEGYSRQVLCGEEDYGSTDLNAYLSDRRKGKVRLALLRLLYPKGLEAETGRELEQYLCAHTKGCKGEETWQIILEEHGNDREFYELFAKLGCINKDNIEGILQDIGEKEPEMKAYFLRYQQEHLGYGDFFADLAL